MSASGDRRPNILLVMADQLAASALPAYGHTVTKAPHLSRLAERATVFENAYCNAPICASSRASMLAGRYATTIGAYDNACDFPSSTPTLPYYLEGLGYRTMLAGKMHFAGPDQLHGYADRLTTDIYPADFAWTPNWLAGPRDKPSGISMRGVIQAGPCLRSLQMDYDDEVAFWAAQALWDLAREDRATPFFLTVSLSHPHSPFTVHPRFWDLYEGERIEGPRVPPIPFAEKDVMSQWLHLSHGMDEEIVREEHVLAARRAYYGMISYVDEKLGTLLAILDESGLAENTIVVFTSDHGEMLGERGMWYKQTFFENSARVPLMVAMPGAGNGRRVPEVVSLIDLLPTLLDLATDGRPPEAIDPLDGVSLAEAIHGGAGRDFAISEYTDMGVLAPSRMVRRGSYKHVYTHGQPPLLFNLATDPDELTDLASLPEHSAVEASLRAELLANWDPEAVRRAVLASQRRRLALKGIMQRSGRYPDWSWQATRDDTRRFVRGSGATGAKAKARFPPVS